jgi:magnesium chelatase family protein
MGLADARETTRIPSCRRPTGGRPVVVTTRPFRAPHHTISEVGVIGGGQRLLPGEVSLAHHGLLWLDERPACTSQVLEVLRQALEKGIM